MIKEIVATEANLLYSNVLGLKPSIISLHFAGKWQIDATMY